MLSAQGSGALLGRLALVMLSVAVTLVLIEGLLALLHTHKAVPEKVFEIYDPVLGWGNRPDADGDVLLSDTSIFHRHHNSRGLRDPRDIPYEKPSGTLRVLLLGDSFFWGYGLDEGDVISAVLQRLVPPRVEILNGASRGYGTDQELLWLTREGVRYQPDVVILGVFAANDWDDIARPMRYGYPKPYFRIEDGRLALHNVPVPRRGVADVRDGPASFSSWFGRFLRERTHIYPFVIRRLCAVPEIRLRLLRRGLALEPSADPIGGTVVEILPEREIRPLFEELLREISALTRRAGANFLLVFIPVKENTPGANMRYDGVLEGAERMNDEASRYLGGVASANGYFYLDLLPQVRAGHRSGEVLYNPQAHDHHWTSSGSRLAAEAIAAWLASRATSPGGG